MIQPIHVASPSPVSEASPSATPPKAGPGFGKMIEDLLSQVNAEQAQAGQAVRDLATGKTDNVHGVMLAVAKADLSFRLCLEIRNRLTEALQEIMRMQV